jgi:hypothetical protein
LSQAVNFLLADALKNKVAVDPRAMPNVLPQLGISGAGVTYEPDELSFKLVRGEFALPDDFQLIGLVQEVRLRLMEVCRYTAGRAMEEVGS